MAISTIGSDGLASSSVGSTQLASSSVTRAKIGYAGAVLQVVNVQSGALASTTTTIPLDNTIPQNTEGAELFTVSITPTSATTKLLITANVELSSSAGGWLIITIFQDSTANAIAATTSYMASATGGVTIPLTYYMTSGTTSSTTFKLRYGQNSAGTTTVNASASNQIFGGVCISSMTVTEIAV